MIIKGQARGRSKDLATHLLRADQNERVRVFEARGTVATDVAGALAEMEAISAGVISRRPLYHASISPEANTPLSDEQVRVAVDTLESALGLGRQPRLVVLHRKAGREHVHVVWSRIDIEQAKAINDSWNYPVHESVARELETRFGHRRIPSSHSRTGSAKRSPKEYEYRQQERSGASAAQIAVELTELWNAAADGQAFRAKLAEAGYTLARGDRRVFVIIDRAGEVHSLGRRIPGATTRAVRERLKDVQLQELPSVAEVRARRRAPQRSRRPAPMFAAAAQEVSRPRGVLRRQSREIHPTLRSVLSFPTNVAETVRPSRLEAGRLMRRVALSVASPCSQRYRALRASLIAEYAARIAAAFRDAPQQGLDAALAALRGERQAALDALDRCEHIDRRGRRDARRGKRRSQGERARSSWGRLVRYRRRHRASR